VESIGQWDGGEYYTYATCRKFLLRRVSSKYIGGICPAYILEILGGYDNLMSISNVVGESFDLTETVVSKKSISELKLRKQMLNEMIDGFTAQVAKLKLDRDAVQALIDAARLAGATEDVKP
jgi:hypothetical protein